MDKHKAKEQLGIAYGTACNRLRKKVLFDLVKRLRLDTCFRCAKPIDTEKELSVEHKRPWLDTDDPEALFYDLDNIAFSHLACNTAAARRPHKRYHTAEERKEADRRLDREGKRRRYSPEKRREKFREKGY